MFQPRARECVFPLHRAAAWRWGSESLPDMLPRGGLTNAIAFFVCSSSTLDAAGHIRLVSTLHFACQLLHLCSSCLNSLRGTMLACIPCKQAWAHCVWLRRLPLHFLHQELQVGALRLRPSCPFCTCSPALQDCTRYSQEEPLLSALSS